MPPARINCGLLGVQMEGVGGACRHECGLRDSGTLTRAHAHPGANARTRSRFKRAHATTRTCSQARTHELARVATTRTQPRKQPRTQPCARRAHVSFLSLYRRVTLGMSVRFPVAAVVCVFAAQSGPEGEEGGRRE
jgi:hypothetical protein